MAKAIWDGDIVKVLKIWFFDITLVLGKLLWNVVSVILKSLWIVFSEISMQILVATGELLRSVLQKVPVIGGLFAAGGITPGGPIIVGEKGPEIVSPPKGSTVHSNADSKGMGGNTIHIHITGRVGASDAEIRDIATKVAREINIRMNRQGTITMGG